MNYRAYFFQNFYLQGIHAGIQSAHTIAEMFVKYTPEHPKYDILSDWASDDKTIVILNGGMQSDLQEIIQYLLSTENPYPWSNFSEEADALNCALTNVGIILPERIYNAPFISKDYNGDEVFEQYRFENDLTEWEVGLIKILKSKRLMN